MAIEERESREAKREQAAIEKLFRESARVQDAKRHQQLAREWSDYHQRQATALEGTLGDLVSHQREQERYQRLLASLVLGVPDDAA